MDCSAKHIIIRESAMQSIEFADCPRIQDNKNEDSSKMTVKALI